MDLVLHNARVMTCDPSRPGLGMVDHGAIAIADGKVAWVGDDASRPPAAREIDVFGQLVSPGLVDCHTHAIFAGDRAHEFELRAAGASYVAIQAAGGGILATLEPTRVAGHVLQELLRERLDRALAAGTTTIEVKTGYDLTLDGELELLDRIGDVAHGRGQTIVPTLLAHLVPPDRAHDRDVFVRQICKDWIPLAKERGKNAPTSVDVWCERNAFTLPETRQIFEAARAHGLAVRGHVGQLSDLGAAELLAEFGALSADHLEYIGDAGISALARVGTVAVMLPGACVQLRLPVPPVEKLRAAGIEMAVATDLNPGSSYCETLPIQMWLATTHFAMTVEEAWLGVTRNAARALGVEAGMLRPGARADLVVWRASDPAEVPYRYGTSLVDSVFVAGVTAS
jgi:imidazolonepropionase